MFDWPARMKTLIGLLPVCPAKIPAGAKAKASIATRPVDIQFCFLLFMFIPFRVM
jgi:hypothetical protein